MSVLQTITRSPAALGLLGTAVGGLAGYVASKWIAPKLEHRYGWTPATTQKVIMCCGGLLGAIAGIRATVLLNRVSQSVTSRPIVSCLSPSNTVDPVSKIVVKPGPDGNNSSRMFFFPDKTTVEAPHGLDVFTRNGGIFRGNIATFVSDSFGIYLDQIG